MARRVSLSKELFNEGLELASEVAHVKGQYRVAASAYGTNGCLLYTGVNSYVKTHPVQAMFAKMVGMPDRIYLHAEIDALIRAGAPVSTMVVTRVGAKGEPLPSKPCKICRLAMKRAGVRRVFYYTEAGRIASMSP